jgi:tRNA (mo5U34)-methyltransferase
MIHPFLEDLGRWNLERFAAVLQARLTERLREIAAGDRKGQLYGDLMARLPAVRPGDVDLGRDWIRIGRPADLPHAAQQGISAALRRLIPWRKGPYEIFGIRVDSEWASYLKWQSPDAPTGQPGRSAGSGYRLKQRLLHVSHAAGHHRHLVLGIEPYLTYYFQFRAAAALHRCAERLHPAAATGSLPRAG